MIILGLDTSMEIGSVAVLRDETLLGESLVRAPMNLLTWLSPAIQRILQETNIPMEKVDAIATSIGPGYFTGIRLQLATAKTLAQVLQIPLYGVSSLEALAFSCLPRQGMILSCLDARRGELFAAVFKADGFNLTQIGEYLAAPPDIMIQKIRQHHEPWTLAGKLNQRQSAFFAEEGLFQDGDSAFSFVRASSVAALACQKQGEQTGDFQTIAPLYIRPFHTANHHGVH